MKFSVDLEEKYAVISLLEEKLDSKIAPKLKSEFLVLNAEGIRNIILDLGATKYADSSGLSAVLIANRLCKNNNGLLVLTNLSEHVEKIINISQLDTVLNILPSKEEAIEAVFLNELEGDFADEETDPEFVEDEIEDLEEVEDWSEEGERIDEKEEI